MQKLLGWGGFADVWEVSHDSLTQRSDSAITTLALKVGRDAEPVRVERFAREAEALVRVGPPFSPKLHEHHTLADGRPYLLMERAAGQTLGDWLEKQREPPDVAMGLEVAIAIARAVAGMHARSVIHRDLKPENVILSGERAVLIDFGLARGTATSTAFAEPITRPGAGAGTLEYVAPEQLRGDAHQDVRADVYSLGAVLHELFSLRPPFAGDAAAVEYGHLALRPPKLGELVPVPAGLERLIRSCLAKDPARRPEDGAEVLAALKAALGDVERAATSSKGVAEGGAPAPEAERPEGMRREGAEGARPLMIADGKRPAAVLVVETDAALPKALSVLAERRAIVARQRGRRIVAVLTASDADAPIEAAISAAEELVALFGSSAAVHIAKVLVRSRPDGTQAVLGPAIDRPETWLSALWPDKAPPREVALTPEARALLAARNKDEGARADLIGRDDALATLRSSLTFAASGKPAQVTVKGDHGLGKSRLLVEAEALFARSLGGARSISIRAAQPLRGEVEKTSSDLLLALAGSGGPLPSHRVDRARRLTSAISDALAGGPLAIFVDDAHWADDALLDALEVSTIEGRAALWVVVAAHPRFDEARPGFGGRAERFDRIELFPLAEAAGKELAARLLAPAEYPPSDALAELHHWAGGNPSCLAEIASALKSAGLVRKREGSEAHYLATSELRRLPESPAWQWLAARALDAMPLELSACARLCAVLGPGLSQEEVEAAQEALLRAGAPSTPLDAGVGLRALCERGVLVRSGEDHFSFRNAVLSAAISAMVDGIHAERIHRAALTFWLPHASAEPSSPVFLTAQERVARHAAAVGERKMAARAQLALGEHERGRHRYFVADTCFTAALAELDEEDGEARAFALAGRGRARYRLFRTGDALADFEAARAIAEAAHRDAHVAELLLEEATALDWMDDYERSAERTRTARDRVLRLADPRLLLRLHVAEGRSAWRHGELDLALEKLDRAARGARSAGDYEPLVVSLLLLSCALVVAGRPDEAEACSDEVILLVTEARDSAHLSIAYLNRFFLWSVRKDLGRAAADMRRALDLAREVGNPWPERGATTNLAELLFWCGRDEESLALAARGRALEERFSPRPVHESVLVMARVHAARGELAEAASLVAWIEERCPPGASAPNARVLLSAVKLVVSGGGSNEAWDELLGRASGLVHVERLEVMHLRARAAWGAGRFDEAASAREQAEALFDESPDFRRRFEQLG